MPEQYNNVFDEIRSKASLCDEMECRGVVLKRSGNNRQKCVCPFPEHNDHQPSMMMGEYEGVERYKCFGCGEIGDVFDFVQKMEKWNIQKVLEYFKKKYSIESLNLDNFEQQLFLVNIKPKVANHIVPQLIRTSYIIRSFLNNSINTNKSLKKIQPCLIKIDRSVFDRDVSSFGGEREFLQELIKDFSANKESLEGSGDISSGTFIVSGQDSNKYFLKKILLDLDISLDRFWFIEDVSKNKDSILEQIKIGKPKSIVLLGKGPLEALIGTEQNQEEFVSGKIYDFGFHKCNILLNNSEEEIISSGGKKSPLYKNFIITIIQAAKK